MLLSDSPREFSHKWRLPWLYCVEPLPAWALLMHDFVWKLSDSA